MNSHLILALCTTAGTVIGFIVGYRFAYAQIRTMFTIAKVKIVNDPIYSDLIEELDRMDPDHQ